jgi:uncharacterized membrane protein
MAATSSAMAVASGVATLALRGGVRAIPPPPPMIPTAWYKLPQPFRFFVSANLGNVCFLCCEKAVSQYLRSTLSDLPDLIQSHRDTVSFFLGYVLHIVAQHYLHAMLVYGPSSIDTPAKYRKTLLGMYSTLMSAAVGSTILNGVFLSYGVDKNVAFVATISSFALFNYFLIGWVVKRSNLREAAKTNKKSTSAIKRDIIKPAPKRDIKPAPKKVTKKKPLKKLNKQNKSSSMPKKKTVAMRGGAGEMPDLTVSREWVRSTGRPVRVDDTDKMDTNAASSYHQQESHDRSSRRASTISNVLFSSADLSTLVRGGAKAASKPPPSSKILGAISNTKSAVANTFYAIPKPLRFFISGNLGNVVFFYCERGVSAGLESVADLPVLVQSYKESVSFFLGYVIHIVFQHFLHAFLVYGLATINTLAKYFTTLFGTYGTYVTSAVLSTALNGAFLKMGMDKTVAFVSTLYFFAIINYLVIGWIVKKSSQDVTVKQGRQKQRNTKTKTKTNKNVPNKRAERTNTTPKRAAVRTNHPPKKVVRRNTKSTSSWSRLADVVRFAGPG